MARVIQAGNDFATEGELRGTGLVPAVQDPFSWSDDFLVIPSMRAFLPYLMVLLVGLLAISFVAEITLILPKLVYGR